MTDDGQAQNSLHANNSNCVGLMGWGESFVSFQGHN